MHYSPISSTRFTVFTWRTLTEGMQYDDDDAISEVEEDEGSTGLHRPNSPQTDNEVEDSKSRVRVARCQCV